MPLLLKDEALAFPPLMPDHPSWVRLSVPATSANVGVGFDALGMAVSLRNTFWVRPAKAPRFQLLPQAGLTPWGAHHPSAAVLAEVPLNEHLLFSTLASVWAALGHPPQALPVLEVVAHVAVPLASGLGSSACVVVAAAAMAALASSTPLSLQALLPLVAAQEHHADNVAPALLGGFRLCPSWQEALPLPWPEAWGLCVLHPTGGAQSTAAARAVLPAQYTRPVVAQALANSAHVVQAVHTACPHTLCAALKADVVHEPFRSALHPHFDTLKNALLGPVANGLNGVLAVVLSGSGPSVLVIYQRAQQQHLETALAPLLLQHPTLHPYWLALEAEGLTVTPVASVGA